MTDMPRILSATAVQSTSRRLVVRWHGLTWPGGDERPVDLDGWIATGGTVLAPLGDPIVFARAAVGEHGASVTWDGDEGDLAIDTAHLLMIAREQLPFEASELTAWQAQIGISNREAAGLLGVSPSTWATYKAGTAKMPHAVRLLCRSVLRDPLMLHAWLHPARGPGRPRRAGAGPFA